MKRSRATAGVGLTGRVASSRRGPSHSGEPTARLEAAHGVACSHSRSRCQRPRLRRPPTPASVARPWKGLSAASFRSAPRPALRSPGWGSWPRPCSSSPVHRRGRPCQREQRALVKRSAAAGPATRDARQHARNAAASGRCRASPRPPPRADPALRSPGAACGTHQSRSCHRRPTAYSTLRPGSEPLGSRAREKRARARTSNGPSPRRVARAAARPPAVSEPAMKRRVETW